MMLIYNYDKDTKEFLSEGEARVNPLVKDEFLIPANATSKKPLAIKADYAVCFINNTWEYVIDNRDKTYYLNGVKVEFALGDTITEDMNLMQYTDAELLATAKDKKKAEMLKAYTAANEQNIDYLSATFQADKDSQALIIAVLSAGSVPTGFYWLDIDNNRIPMTYVELQDMSAALVIRGQINFTKLQDLKVLIDSKLKVSTVEAIVW